jgi:hypothetical protein
MSETDPSEARKSEMRSERSADDHLRNRITGEIYNGGLTVVTPSRETVRTVVNPAFRRFKLRFARF